jgi:hypothetical protein
MTQDRDLNVVGIRSRTAADHAEDPPQDQERQGPDHHGSRSCQARITAAQRGTLTLHPIRFAEPQFVSVSSRASLGAASWPATAGSSTPARRACRNRLRPIPFL